MKRKISAKTIIAGSLCTILFFLFSSCVYISNHIIDLFPEYGNGDCSIIIPAYYRSADGTELRKLDPEKTTAVLSYYDSKTNQYITHKTITLSENLKYEISNQSDLTSFPACTYHFSFNNIPAATYSENQIKVTLVNNDEYEIDSYTNKSNITFSAFYGKIFAAFSTKELSENQTYTLFPNEIRIHPVFFEVDKQYKLKINSTKADVVVFRFDGNFDKYYTNSQIAENKTDFSNVEIEEYGYLAVWNPSTENTEYKLEFTITNK